MSTVAVVISRAIALLREGSPTQAVSTLEKLIEREPRSADAHNALAGVLVSLQQNERAMDSLRAALALRPDHAAARTNLGLLLLEAGRVCEALSITSAVIDGMRAPPQARVNAAQCLCLLGRQHEASEQLRLAANAPAASPSVHSQRCYVALFDPQLTAAEVTALHCGSTAVYERNMPDPELLRSTPDSKLVARTRRLRLGYVSADFREHSVASFFMPVLRAHDRQRWEITLFATGESEDAVTRELRELADHYLACAPMSDAQLAAAVRAAEIDALVDLGGHMQPCRLGLFASRPAPVQFTYLGYPGTTGLHCFDGRVTDHWADPPRADPALTGTEPLIAVEGGYFAYEPPLDAPATAPLPAAVTGVFTFGCFNDSNKLNEAVLGTWAEILRRMPQARLLLKARALASADVQAWIRASFQRSGIASERLRLMAATATRREHLALYAHVDLALDTFPYAGATTTAEALYMGVPVISLAGEQHAGRLGVSVLSGAGLPQFVAADLASYVELALRTAADLPTLARLRAELRAQLRNAPLLDGSRPARAIEQAAYACLSLACFKNSRPAPAQVPESAQMQPPPVHTRPAE